MRPRAWMPKYVMRRLRRGLSASPASEPRWLQWLQGFREVAGGPIEDNVGGSRMRYDRHTDVGRCLFYQAGFEEAEVNLLIRRLERYASAVVLDIGAYVGWYSVRLGRSHTGLIVYAFEPSPVSRGYLETNVAKNGLLGRITIEPVACSSETGKALFFECEDGAYSSLLETGRKPVVGTHEVAVTTVDDFVRGQGLSQVNLLKIDVEGAEDRVLSGARRTILEHRPDLLVEIYQGARVEPAAEATIDALRSAGYRAFVFEGDRIAPYRSHRDWFYNYFFTVDRTFDLLSDGTGRR